MASKLEQDEYRRIAELETSGYFDDAFKRLETQRQSRVQQEKPGILGYNTADDQRVISEKGGGMRFLSDVGNLSYGLVMLASKAMTLPFTMTYGMLTKPKETINETIETSKQIGGSVVKGFKDPLAAVGVFGEEEKRAARTYYSAHPGFAALDVIGIATLGAGTLLKSSITGGAKAATVAVLKDAAVVAGKDAAVDAAVRTSMNATRGAWNPARWLKGATKVSSPFYESMVKAVRTGDVGHVEEVLRTQFVKNGMAEDVAAKLSRTGADAVATNFLNNARKLRALDAAAHPLSALGRATSPAVKFAFGTPAESAVTRVFGADAVKVNRRAALEMEQWLDAIVSKEQGLPSTANNRAIELMKWMERPEYAALSPEERFAHFKNYIKADVQTANLRHLTNNDLFVPVKVVSQDVANAMKSNIADNLETIKGEVASVADEATVVDKTWSEIKNLLEESNGRDFINNEHILRQAFGATGDLKNLYKAIDSLTAKRSSVDFSEWSEEAQKIAAELEGTGYRIGVAPSDKVVSLVSETVKDTASRITDASLDSQRSFVGKALDAMGLSAKGVPEGSSTFFFRESFNQLAIKELGERFGGIIKIKNAFGKGRTIRVQVGQLYEFLNKNIERVNKAKKETAEGGVFALGEVAAEATKFNRVYDFDAKTLREIGFTEDASKIIDQINRKALRDIPLSVTGLGDKMVNLLRGASRDLAITGRHFDKYIKGATYMRYRSALAFLFQLQQGFETSAQGALLTGGRYVPGAESILNISNKLSNKKLFGVLKNVEPVLKKMVAPVDVGDTALIEAHVIPDIYRGLDDVASSIELSQVQDQLSRSRGAVNGGKLNKIYQKHIQMWAVDKTTKVSAAYAEKFGMTLKQAFEQNADGTFKNPRIVREIKDLSQTLLYYRQGFLTSPAAKTLNLVFFPFRFQAKTLDITAKWLGNMSPATRVAVIDNWIHFSNWAGTDEGIEWRRTHKNLFHSFLSYATAYEQMGDSINAVSRGQLFGGNTGLIGGVPFAWLVEFARDLALIPEDPESYDPATGRPFELRETPKEFWSSATGVKLLEEFVFTLMPGMPFYTLSGGLIEKASVRHLFQGWIDGIYGGVLTAKEGLPKQAADALIRDQFMKVPVDETVPLFNR